MTFRELSLKMLKHNFLQYRIYFSCNCISTVIFFCFASLFLNEQFMNGQLIDSMISSNIILPSVLMTGFMILFLPFSYQVFWSLRRQDYGIFLSLGMSKKEAVRNITLESVCVSVLALFAAYLIGTVCSALFYGFLKSILNIRELRWVFPKKSFLLTGILYSGIMIFTIALYSLKLLWQRIICMMKHHEKAEKMVSFSIPSAACFPHT